MPIDQGALDAVATGNVKTVAEATSFYAGLAFANAISHQQAMNQILVGAVGQVLKRLTEVDVEEAISVMKELQGSGMAVPLTVPAATAAAARST